MKYSLEFREKVINTKNKYKLTIKEISKRFDISSRTVQRWKKSIVAKKYEVKNKIDLEKLAKDVKEYPDAYQYERSKRLNSSQSSVCRGLKELGITYKKSTRTYKNTRKC